MTVAQDVFVPATLSNERSIERYLEFPEVAGDVDVVVRCDARVTRSGKIRSNHCFTPDDSYGPFLKPIARAVRVARLTPASVNGRRVDVYFQYSLVFRRKDGQESIDVYPSHLRERARLGTNYSGAQRYLAGGDLWRGCWRRGIRVWIALSIDAQGIVRDGRVLGGDDRHDCGSKIVRNSHKSRYIPAMKDGKPVAVTYVECFWIQTVW